MAKPSALTIWPRLSITTASRTLGVQAEREERCVGLQRAEQPRGEMGGEGPAEPPGVAVQADTAGPNCSTPPSADQFRRSASRISRRARASSPPPRCTQIIPAASSAPSAVAPIASRATCGPWGAASRRATPRAEKTTWEASSMVRSTVQLAAAWRSFTPFSASRRARTTSPPSWATGSRAFTASRIQR